MLSRQPRSDGRKAARSMSAAAPPAPSPAGKSGWVRSWAQGGGRGELGELPTVRASPRLCHRPGKLPAEEEAAAAAARAPLRSPLRARLPPRRRPRSRCCCRKMDPGCTSANHHRERGEEKERRTDGRTERKGRGVGGPLRQTAQPE